MSARAKPRRQSLLKARQAILRGPAIVPADPLSFCFSLRQSIVDADRDTKNKVSMALALFAVLRLIAKNQRRQFLGHGVDRSGIALAAERFRCAGEEDPAPCISPLPTRGGASRTERTS